MSLSLPEAYLAGLTSTSILYGISCATYYACARSFIGEALVQRHTLPGTRWILLIVATGMWLISAVGVGQMLQHMLTAFVYYKGEGGAEAELSDIRDPMNIVHALTYPIQAALGDSFLVYRTWVVYGHSWRIALPLLVLLTGDLVAGLGITAAEFSLRSRPHITVTKPLHPETGSWVTAFFALTLSLNFICTGLIIIQILRVTSQCAALRVTISPSQRVMKIILESGLIYTSTSLIVIVIITIRSNALYIVADSFIPITAICFHLIILRTETFREERSTEREAESLPLHLVNGGTAPCVAAPVTTVVRQVDEGSIRDVPLDSQASLWPPRKGD